MIPSRIQAVPRGAQVLHGLKSATEAALRVRSSAVCGSATSVAAARALG